MALTLEPIRNAGQELTRAVHGLGSILDSPSEIHAVVGVPPFIEPVVQPPREILGQGARFDELAVEQGDGAPRPLAAII